MSTAEDSSLDDEKQNLSAGEKERSQANWRFVQIAATLVRIAWMQEKTW
jgi:hypothetical protein